MKMNEGQVFFSRILIRAFGIQAEAAFVKEVIKKENNGEIPKGLLVDKTV